MFSSTNTLKTLKRNWALMYQNAAYENDITTIGTPHHPRRSLTIVHKK
jgi:hypothetical protein